MHTSVFRIYSWIPQTGVAARTGFISFPITTDDADAVKVADDDDDALLFIVLEDILFMAQESQDVKLKLMKDVSFKGWK